MDGMKSAVRALRAAGDPTRLRILAALGVRPLCVCELVSLVDVGQPAVSRHLGLLEAAGLVDSDRQGRWVTYRLAEIEAGEPLAGFAAGLLREVQEFAARDPAATELIERARTADRHALREAAKGRCIPEPADGSRPGGAVSAARQPGRGGASARV